MKEDEWADVLRCCGYYLGKFVYLMDAYEDLEKDQRKKEYNPWIPYLGRPDFDALVEKVRFAIPELLELNRQSALQYNLTFLAERHERVFAHG